MSGARQVYVDVDDRQHDHRVDAAHLADLLAATLHDQHGAAAGGEVGLAFVGVDEMTALNGEHMGGDGPTDVLAFPLDGLAESRPVPPGQPVLFGDVVVCPAVADRAPQSLADELALLVVHGALHLLGHDHREPAERAEMKALETSMLDRYHPFDRRAAGTGP